MIYNKGERNVMFMKLFLVEDATIYMILLQIYYTKEGVKMKKYS